jgi:hypothetical protein
MAGPEETGGGLMASCADAAPGGKSRQDGNQSWRGRSTIRTGMPQAPQPPLSRLEALPLDGGVFPY